jgi:hypothetical protein
MRLGLYIFAALTLTAIMGAFAYTINPNNYIVEILGINFNFPVAVWFILPMVFLLVFTIIHMVFYSLKSYFKLKKWRKDAATLDDALYWSIVNEPKEQKYAIPEIASSAALLAKSNVTVLDTVEGLSPRLAKVLNITNKIKNGEYVDLKEHKMAKVFNEGNPLLIHNRLNRLKTDDKFVEDVMKSSSSFSDEVRAEALSIFAAKETFFKARKYHKIFDVKNFFVMLNRVHNNGEEDVELTGEILNDFVSTLKLSCQDYANIANITKKLFRPDENLALFKKYQEDNHKAQAAYLYLLFEYELMDKASAYLDEQDDYEFTQFRALYNLKQSHKNYKLENLIDIRAICK